MNKKVGAQEKLGSLKAYDLDRKTINQMALDDNSNQPEVIRKLLKVAEPLLLKKENKNI